MKALKNKLGKDGGFTLVEMLIVVAIIAILVAISIPLIGGALEKARDTTDQANERSAKAEAVITYLNSTVDSTITGTGTFYFDAVKGQLLSEADAKGSVTGKSAMTGYGRCECATDPGIFAATGFSSGHKGLVLKVTITSADNIALEWVDTPKA